MSSTCRASSPTSKAASTPIQSIGCLASIAPTPSGINQAGCLVFVRTFESRFARSHGEVAVGVCLAVAGAPVWGSGGVLGLALLTAAGAVVSRDQGR